MINRRLLIASLKLELLAGVAEDTKYKKKLDKVYPPQFSRHIQSSEAQALAFMGLSSKDMHTLEAGNTMVRYARKPIPGMGRDAVLLFAMISDNKKISRSEVADLRKWVGKFEEALLAGDVVLSSFNAKTRQIAMNAVKRAQAKSEDNIVTQNMPGPPTSHNGETWETLLVYRDDGQEIDPTQLMVSFGG